MTTSRVIQLPGVPVVEAPSSLTRLVAWIFVGASIVSGVIARSDETPFVPRTLAGSVSMGEQTAQCMADTPVRHGACVAGTNVPTPESQLAEVSTAPSIPDHPASEFLLDYPHRRGELLVFPRAGETRRLTEVEWLSIFQRVGAECMRFDAAASMFELRFPDPNVTLSDRAKEVQQLSRNQASITANSCIFAETEKPKDLVCSRLGGKNQWFLNQIRVPAVWAKRVTGSSSMNVAVMDSGIEHSNPNLHNFWCNPCYRQNNQCTTTRKLGCHPMDTRTNDIHGWNFVSNDDRLVDDYGHGTMVAGIIGADHSTSSVSGINWKASLMDLRVWDTSPGALSGALSAIAFAADYEAKVVNVSFTTAASPDLEDAIKKNGGMIFVAAAGDKGIAVGPGHEGAFPCIWALPNLLCVTSSNRDDDWAGDNYGQPVQLAAPGVDIASTFGRSCGQQSGTSLAVPQIVGVIALLWSRFPSESAETIVNRVLHGMPVKGALKGKTESDMRVDALCALGDAGSHCPPGSQ